VAEEALGDGVGEGVEAFVEGFAEAGVIFEQELGLLGEFGEREG
jgi:hypothetical protein